jgi:cell division protease FtsH
MATEYGMSDKLGPLLYGDVNDEVFLGRSMVQRNTHLSDQTQKLVDLEIKRFVEEGYDTAQKVIRENMDELHKIARALLEFETLSGDEIRGVLVGKSPVRDTDSETSGPKGTGVPSAGKGKAGRRRSGPSTDDGMEPQPEG